MKKISCLLFVLFAVLISFAQTQQGIVKTRGRMVDGQLVKGERLAGVAITMDFGVTLVSDSQGTFYFNVPESKTFSLVSATKQGYTLADPECTKRAFAYSENNPFYVVLEEKSLWQADINVATRKVRKILSEQFEKREEEIKVLKAQNKLTEAEYQERLWQLYDNQSNSEKLVKEMAERYVSTDYDQLDEFNRQVQSYIEEGELQKADSLLNTKGRIDERLEAIDKFRRANEENLLDLTKDIKTLALLYARENWYSDATETINKAISLLPDNADCYDTKGEILLMQGKNNDALEMWKKVLELNPNFLKEYPNGTNLSNGLKKLGLIE